MMDEFISLAKSLADAAGEIAREHFRKPFDIIGKDDASPVTIADRAIEQRLREMIGKARPQDGILGEEFGKKKSESGLTWVLDPIDGTKPFTTGRATFGTLIALCECDAPVLGMIDQPIIKDRWLGVKGQNTTHNGADVKTRACTKLADAVSATTSPSMFDECLDTLWRWRDASRYVVWGGDCLMYGQMASGWIDCILEAKMQHYDYLAHVPIIEGAGGFISDWQGAPLTLDSGDTVMALGDKALLDEIQKIIN